MANRRIKNMNLQKLQFDFLWYSYFGTARINTDMDDEKKEEALITCINRAYRDANRKMKYSFSEKTIKGPIEKDTVKEFKKLKKAFSPSVTKENPESVKLIQGHIHTLLSKNNEGFSANIFDTWHKCTCDCLMDYANNLEENGVTLFENNAFIYGHAQKWINMTLKYMLVMGLWNNELNEKAQYFHVPIDSFIIKEAKDKFSDKLHEYWTNKHWYQVDDYNEYLDFQTLIRNQVFDLSPIEWEAEAWIRRAIDKE